MKVLFTGASSFTGYWFVKELAKRGHEVVSIFKSSPESYQGVRKRRVDALKDYSVNIFNCEFGSDQFIHLINQASHWDLFCHHAADATNYKSPDFNPIAALQQNANQLPIVLKALQNKNCRKVILTGSVFEQDEGENNDEPRAFSPYGLSKGLTYQMFRYYADLYDMHLGKFVIPNPFGPFEEPRFTDYLIRTWMQHKPATVSTPKYVRDNIPVDLLALGYGAFADKLKDDCGISFMHPSGYAETQGAFAERFASEIRSRLNLRCDLFLVDQQDFPEPRMRINSENLLMRYPEWIESSFWDSVTAYYQSIHLSELQLLEK